ncbi:hypothetical protein [Natrinema sp. DC36]|uniref:hypothetical protein n=1 Tax=Natrinema sp. DC36 TaxID=2878680 RepID=UPI001CF056CC|nr:hypothetical protein [Natrinema sp. DC36]
MDKSRGQSGLDRFPNTKLTARTLLTLAVVLSVALAGCTGMGGVGVGGDGENDGTGSSTGDGDDLNSMVGAEDDWFNLSRPGHYAFDLAGMDEETGEQVSGQLVYDIEDAGEEVTVSVDYEFGDEQYQSTITSPRDEVMGQLFLTPAHAPVLALQSASVLYYFEMGFTNPAVGNRKQTTTDEGTQITEVTEKRSYAGLECVFVETTVDGERSQQSCLRGSDGGSAPYVATYTEEGELELEVELVEYESN